MNRRNSLPATPFRSRTVLPRLGFQPADLATLLFALLLASSSGFLWAQETSPEAANSPTAPASNPPEDSLLPQPFNPEALNDLVANPPFTRTVNPSDSLVLSGLAFIQGKPVATLFDTETKQSIAVSDKPNSKGWTLAEALPVTSMSRAQAKISIGGEIVTIRYNKEALTPDKLKKEKPSAPSGTPPPQGPPPGGGYERSGPRPSQEDIERFRSLSDKAKDRLREEFSRNRERLMNATPEERAAFMRSTFERVQREDQGGRGSGDGDGGRRR